MVLLLWIPLQFRNQFSNNYTRQHANGKNAEELDGSDIFIATNAEIIANGQH
jgi:hypothetical protein